MGYGFIFMIEQYYSECVTDISLHFIVIIAIVILRRVYYPHRPDMADFIGNSLWGFARQRSNAAAAAAEAIIVLADATIIRLFIFLLVVEHHFT